MKKGTKINRAVSPTYLRGLTANLEYRQLLQDTKNKISFCILCDIKDDLMIKRYKKMTDILIDNNILDVKSALACKELYSTENMFCICKTCNEKAYQYMLQLIKTKQIPLN